MFGKEKPAIVYFGVPEIESEENNELIVCMDQAVIPKKSEESKASQVFRYIIEQIKLIECEE